MSSIGAFVRRVVAASVLAATLAIAGTAGSAAVAPAKAEAAVYLRIICQDVYWRNAIGAPPHPVSWNPLTYGTIVELIEWPSTPGWVKIYVYGARGYIDSSCVTLA